MNQLICCVLVTYNRLDILQKTLGHIFNQTVQPDTIIIVDNNSIDGTKEFLNSLHQKNIKCIFLDNNTGVGTGLSAGMKYGLALKNFDFYWLLDDDSFYADNTLEELVNSIKNTEFALLGVSGSNFKWGTKRKPALTKKVQQVDYALIDGALIKAEAIKKIGTLEERFFMMCADDEYIIRLKKNGYAIGLLNIESYSRLHLGGQGSFTKGTMWRGYYSARNHLLILKKYFSLPALFSYIFNQSKFIIAAAFLAPDRVQRVKLRVLGIWHGIKGVEGKTLDPVTLKF